MDRITEVRAKNSSCRPFQAAQRHLQSRHDIPTAEVGIPARRLLRESLWFLVALSFICKVKTRKQVTRCTYASKQNSPPRSAAPFAGRIFSSTRKAAYLRLTP